MSRSVTLLCLILSVGLVSSNHVDCHAATEKCKHADSCESCGVHLLEKVSDCFLSQPMCARVTLHMCRVCIAFICRHSLLQTPHISQKVGSFVVAVQ